MEKRADYRLAGWCYNSCSFFVHHLDIQIPFALTVEKGECFRKFAFHFFP